MKKQFSLIAIILVFLLAACGGGSDQEDSSTDQTDKEAGDDATEIKIGASSTPHAEILEEAAPLLEEEGIILEIEEYQDYVFPNDDVESGELDANFFQHLPYLDQTVADTGYELESLGGIHIEPMGVYSKSITDINDIPDETEVILSNSVADHGRVLALLENEDLIQLDDSIDKETATIDDIVDNPKNLTFAADYEAAFLPEIYEKETETLVVINTNYAMDAGLNPLEDALFIEGDESSYANIIAVRTEDVDDEALNTVVDVLHSEEIQDFIMDHYDGAVVPVNDKE